MGLSPVPFRWEANLTHRGGQRLDNDNYKGNLQQYCQQKGLSPPDYETNQVGSPNDPSWTVTVKWGSHEHTTPEPIAGSKKTAEQVAAQQALAEIAEQDNQREARQEAYLAPNRETVLADALDGVGVETGATPEDSEMPTGEPITVPVELVTTALGIANHRLTELKRDQRPQRTRGDSRRPYMGSAPPAEEFPKQLAQLTMEIVRHVHAQAGQQGIVFKDESKSESRE